MLRLDVSDTQVYASGVDETQTPDLRSALACFLPAVQAKVDKANKKAVRLGLSARITLTVVERRWVKEDALFAGPDHLAPQVEVVDYTVTGDTVVLPGGWSFLAALDHGDGAGVNVVRRAPNLADDVQVPEWARTVGPGCDHCGQDRRRNDTYLVTNKAGEVKQVGSSCLVDFLGLTPAQVGWVFQSLDDHSDAEEHGPRVAPRLPLVGFLTVVAYFIRTKGWTSRGAAQANDYLYATADSALSVFTPANDHERKEAREVWAAVTEADEKAATDALAWVASPGFDIDGDYGWNLRATCVEQQTLSFRNAGIAGSLVYCWLRKSEQIAERAAKAAASTSVHLGTVGAKETLLLTVTGTRAFDGDYGTRLLVKAVTPEGSEVTCWTSPSTKFGAWAEAAKGTGTVTPVKATIKEHGEFNGVAQTTITRATVVA